jgi:hypothetical protein
MSAFPSPSTEAARPLVVFTLRSMLDACKAEGRRVPLAEAIRLILPTCTELHERHARGEQLFVHPSAICAGPDGEMRLSPPLAVRPSDPRDRAAMAPELSAEGSRPNARASVYTIGAILYESVCGIPVGPGMARPRDVDPNLPETLEHVLATALVQDPRHRPEDLAALAKALQELLPLAKAPAASVPPPRPGSTGDFEIDIRLSIVPPDVAPNAGPGMAGAPAVAIAPNAPLQNAPAPKARRDATTELASLKVRLEGDPQPRYVVEKDRMDHGPFSAVELLQQIASHNFVGKDRLRDDHRGVNKTIDEWEEFAPFAEHARRHRDIAHEKRAVASVERAEKKAGVAKIVVGALLAFALVTVGVLFVVRQVGARKDSADLSDDPSAVDLSGGGSLKGAKKPGQTGGGKGGPGGGFAGGMSYEQAIASNNQEIDMGAGRGAPDLTDQQLQAPMRNGSFLGACGAPDSMKVKVQVAVRNGRAVGVSVFTTPSNSSVASCIDRHVRGLGWPPHPKLDLLTTTY